MKQAEIQIGGCYLTYVGGGLARVVVVRRETNRNGRTVFVVRRFGGLILPKARTAAALRLP
jgi:hypothetical protein